MDTVAMVERHPLPGETVPGSALSYFPGGKGANQSVAAARAGASVTMLGAVGDDAFGATLLDFLRKAGVDVDFVGTRTSMSTGTALIVVDSSGENSIVVVPGANASLDDSTIAMCEPRKGDVLVAQLETPIEVTLTFFGRGHEANATCVLNAAPAQRLAAELLRLVDVLVVNETELAVISGLEVGTDPAPEGLKAAYEILFKDGFRGCLVATLGARGSITLIGDRFVHVDGRRVVPVDTTGAGDCFVGYLCSALAEGKTMDHALNLANVAASICIQRPGAAPSIPSLDEVVTLQEQL